MRCLPSEEFYERADKYTSGIDRAHERTPVHRRIVAIAIALCLLAPAACAPGAEPVRVSRPALGTVVTIEVYGENDRSSRAAIDQAFAVIAGVEAELDACSTTSTIAAVNADPFRWHELPVGAQRIDSAVKRLGVRDSFSPYLLGVVKLYDFAGAGHVPTEGEISAALMAASVPEHDGARFRFAGITSSLARPGLDYGGAAKGLALDSARESLRTAGTTAALITAGSTTITLGSKPDGTPWRVGVEDPRATDTVRLIAEWTGEATLSTSGDYQQYFEVDGIRYHHILDPGSGTPVRGTRSLTVVGRISGTDSDILSTALFVQGPDAAVAYAKAHGLGVFIIDAEGRTHVAPAPEDAGISLAEQIEE
ncbi:MAG: FAD:protein FMN transferase [Actinobacteria bacterium]|nr:MAG: FAD:protein FMN transferase [Actinomycetota bacterium]